MFKLSGLIPAVFTPFDKTGAINFSQIQPYADKLIAEGAYGVFVCGSTGECTSMTVAERKSVLEAWTKAVAGRILIIAHVGGTCQADCIELARHAAGLGGGRCRRHRRPVLPQTRLGRRTGGLLQTHRRCMRTAALLRLPHSLDDGHNLPMIDFLKNGSKEIPNLNGIKFTSNNFMEMIECIRFDGGRFDILNGFDEMLLCGMAVGARGGVGSTYNYSLRTYQNIYDAFMAGDLEQARAAQQESVDIVHVIINHGGGIRGGKASMKLVGIDCGDCRLPLAPYTEAEIARLDEELRAIGFKK